MAYQKQTWRDFDDTKTDLQNINNGAVVTPERLNHIENGIANSADKAEVTAQLQQTENQISQLDEIKAGKIEVVGTNKRIDNLIIASGGESNIEVEDAHVSITKNKEFDVIGERIEEIEKDTFVPIKNIVNNGDFSNGTAGWSSTSSTLSVLENKLIVTGNGISQNVNAISVSDSIVNPANKYYLQLRVKVTNPECLKIIVRLDGETTGTDKDVYTIDKPVANQEYAISTVATPPTDATGRFKMFVLHQYPTAGSALDKVMEVSYVLVTNLSKSFGVGEEPTISTMYDIVKAFPNEWFEGTENLFNARNVIKKANQPSKSDMEIEKAKVSEIKKEAFADIDGRFNSIEQETFVPIENIINNGDFSKGTVGWSSQTAQLSSDNNRLIVSGSGVSNRVNAYSVAKSPVQLNNKYYIRASVRVTNPDCLAIFVYIRGGDGDTSKEVYKIENPEMNRDYQIIIIETLLDDAKGEPMITFLHEYPTATQANGKVLEVSYVSMIDLTTTFGKFGEPSENDLEDIMSNHPNNWFDGAENLFKGKDIVRRLMNVPDEITYQKTPDKMLSWSEPDGTTGIIYDLFLSIPDKVLHGTRANGLGGRKIWKYSKFGDPTSYEEGIDFQTVGIPGNVIHAHITPYEVVYVSQDIANERGWVYKARDIYDPNPELVLTLNTGYPIPMNCYSHYDGVLNMLMVGEYGHDTSKQPRKFYISTDGGSNFRVLKESTVLEPTRQNHWHAAWFDPYDSRIWLSEGDTENRNLHYTSDYGATWTTVNGGEHQDKRHQPTLIFGWGERVIFGRDAIYKPMGMDSYEREVTQSGRDQPVKLIDKYTVHNDVEAAYAYPELPIGYTPGGEAYVLFTSTAKNIQTVLATGDSGKSWMSVYAAPYSEARIEKIIGPTNEGYLCSRLRTHYNDDLPLQRLIYAEKPTWN